MRKKYHQHKEHENNTALTATMNGHEGENCHAGQEYKKSDDWAKNEYSHSHEHESDCGDCDSHSHEHGCGCCDSHQHQNKYMLYRIGGALFFFAIAFSGLLPSPFDTTLMIAAYLTAGIDIVWQAVKNLLRGKWLDENSLMAIATAGAVAIGEYPEAAMVMILYQSGEYLQHGAVEKSKRSIATLMDIRPDYAYIEENENIIRKAPQQVNIGEILVVKSGEKIPLDGKVIAGEAIVDASALTGESRPYKLEPGDEALSGCINTNGLLKIKVGKTFGESTAAKILELVEHADARKARTEKFITRFARYYTPAVVGAAILLALIPPLTIPGAVFSVWLQRALTFLVISCPCALVISIPLTFFAGIGSASRNGILIKGSNYLETLAHTGTVILDKTGTLTHGIFEVCHIIPYADISIEDLLHTAAAAENISNHPIAQSIRRAAKTTACAFTDGKIEELAGMGICMKSKNGEILVGNRKLMDRFNIFLPQELSGGTVVYVARSGKYLGALIIADRVKNEAAVAISRLQKLGINTVMLTGDTQQAAHTVAQELGINSFYAGLLPGQKVEKMEKIIEENKGKSVIFAGDGINDAPVLTRADVGIAMGGLGSDAAIEAADAVIMDDNPAKIVDAITISRKTMRIVQQNIVLALGIKGIFLLLGAFGMVTMWGAVFADVGVSLLAVTNALRALRN